MIEIGASEVEFVVIFIEKTSPIDWQYSDEDFVESVEI